MEWPKRLLMYRSGRQVIFTLTKISLLLSFFRWRMTKLIVLLEQISPIWLLLYCVMKLEIMQNLPPIHQF
ncbi:hypothetical protein BG36_08275 [Aquamicrobium defluvii]|uniref:Uncharacterized protein n=1 Tax=Aquamicrobium defluvii TaxID=69279 RepID=A0A011U1H9_9HYPH|nr:hypothetical protein BG36_08275 [Aquamicrobium defluvii]